MNEAELQALAALQQRNREQCEAALGRPGDEGAAEPEAAVTDFDAGARESVPAPASEAEFLLGVLDRHYGRECSYGA